MALAATPIGRYYFKVQYGTATYDIHSQSSVLSQLRRLFNEKAQGTIRRDEEHSFAAAASSPVASVALIPARYRVWLYWDSRWTELIHSDVLKEFLQEMSDVSEGMSPFTLLFRAEDAASPNTSPPPLRPGIPTQQKLFKDEKGCEMQPPVANIVDPYTHDEVTHIPEDDRVLVHEFGSRTSVQSYVNELAELKADTDLYLRLQFLVVDLLKLKNDDRWAWDILHPPSTGQSEEEVVYFSGLFLPSLYFSLEEQLRLSQFPTAAGVEFAEAVSNIVKGKFTESSASASTTGAHVCSSHDLAPLFRNVFGLDNNFYKNPNFKSEHQKFEKKLKKRLKDEAGGATGGGVTGTMPAEDEYSISSSSTTEDFVLPANTPQLVKLLALQAEQELNDQIYEKLEKKIKQLSKEVGRMTKKKQAAGGML